MPEITIKYEKPETLKLLRAFARYLDLKILTSKSGKKTELIVNGVTVIPADTSIDTSDMESVFSGKNVDAAILRQKAWQRK